MKMLHEARAEPPPPGDDADVHLTVGGALPGVEPVVLRAHRLVLATVSPVFHEWFRQADAELAAASGAGAAASASASASAPASARSGSPREPITIELADFPPDAVSLSLEVMYGGGFSECRHWEIAANCWDFAVRFRVAELQKVARKKSLQMMDLSNSLHLLAYALTVDDEAAIDTIADYIAVPEHFLQVIASRDFLFAPGPVLDALTIRPGAGSTVPDSKCTVEKAWFDAVMRWLSMSKAELNGEAEVPANGEEDRAPPAAAGAVVAAAAAEVGSAVSGANQDNHSQGQAQGQAQSRQGRQLPAVPLKPPVYPRMRHVDHVLELIEFTRMKTEELAVCAEEVTACHAARFPNLLIPLLVERTILLEQERGEREREIKDLGSAFRAAVYAKNESERNEVVTASRLEKVRDDNKELRKTLDATARRQSHHASPQGMVAPVSRSPSPLAITMGHQSSSAPRSPVIDTHRGQPFDPEGEVGVGLPASRANAEELSSGTTHEASSHGREGVGEVLVSPGEASASGENAGEGTGVRGSPVGAGASSPPRQVTGRTVTEGVATQLAVGRLIEEQQRPQRRRSRGKPAASGRAPYYGEAMGPPIPTPRGNYWGHPAPVPPHAVVGGPPIGQYRPGGVPQMGAYHPYAQAQHPALAQRVNNAGRDSARADPRERIRRAAEILGRHPELLAGRSYLPQQRTQQLYGEAAVAGSPAAASGAGSRSSRGHSGREYAGRGGYPGSGDSSARNSRGGTPRGSPGGGSDGVDDSADGGTEDYHDEGHDGGYAEGEDGEQYRSEDGHVGGEDYRGEEGHDYGRDNDVERDSGISSEGAGHGHEQKARILSPNQRHSASPAPSGGSRSGSSRRRPGSASPSHRAGHAPNMSRSSSRSGTSKVPSRARSSPHGSHGVRSPPPVSSRH